MLNTFDLILFGGTGDLSTRKLLPALFRQETVSSIDPESNIICVGTKDLSQADYIEIAKASLIKNFPAFEENKESWSRFKNRISYKRLDIKSDEDWRAFNSTDNERVTVFYLAIPPNLYEDISKKLKDHNLITPNSRIVVEKPIGTDKNSAAEINKHLSSGFKENQIYRIDHYLGKEAVQNLLALRFANTIFEQSWSIIQFVAIAGSAVFARLSERTTNVFAIKVGVAIWMLLCFAAYFVQTAGQFSASFAKSVPASV